MEVFFESLVIGFVLTIDSFTVALALGVAGFSSGQGQKFLFAGVSAFSGLLSVALGIFFGALIMKNFSAYDHWIAFSLLFFVSLEMLWNSYKSIKKIEVTTGPTNKSLARAGLMRLLLVTLATNIDALGVAMGWSVKSQSPVWLLFWTALFAFFGTFVGLGAARKLNASFGPRIGLVGAILLLGLSLKMLEI